jgi:EAL domain-containing protein (putative c-di-GMP-specific phosphodiesterase class I)
VILIAKKLCESFSTPFYLNNLNQNKVFITTSIGISIYPDDGEDMQILLKNADMALYRAKEHGKNIFAFYTDEMNEKIIRKLAIVTHLRSAIDTQGFALYYQPIVDTTYQTIKHFEALLRWKHPELGWISPAEFIPIAEEIGLIVPMGEWILHTTCLQIRTLIHHGIFLPGMRIAVNFSARQFRENNLVERVKAILLETGLSGKYLTFELTEGLIMQDIERSTRVIDQLKKLGIAISIDDFGTGYSSLNYLRRFPIDTIKIDRSFITDLMTNADDSSIVTAIIVMAHSLKMKVIAEGVETLEQYHSLKERGCDLIQGYFISKALPAKKMAAFLRHHDKQLYKQLFVNPN